MDSTATYAPHPSLVYRSYVALLALLLCAYLALTSVTHTAPLSSPVPLFDTAPAHPADASDEGNPDLLITNADLPSLLAGRNSASLLSRHRFASVIVTGLHIRAPPAPQYV